MDRREFLRTGGAAAATVTTASAVGSAVAAHPAPHIGTNLRELRLAMPWAESFAGPADQALRLARDIAERSEGRIRLVPAFEVADAQAAVRDGAADIFFANGHEHTRAHAGFAFFAGLPGTHGLAPEHLRLWIDEGGGEALWDELAAERGFKPLLASHTGSRSYLFASEMIDAMPDLAGRQIVIDGLGRDVARGLGLEPFDIRPAQVATALAGGKILAAECGGAIASYALGLPRTAAFQAGTSINTTGNAITLGISRTYWEHLTAADQQIFRACAAAEFARSLAEESAHRDLLQPRAQADRVWPITTELTHTIGRITDAVVAHATGTDQTTRRIGSSYSAFKRLLGSSATPSSSPIA